MGKKYDVIVNEIDVDDVTINSGPISVYERGGNFGSDSFHIEEVRVFTGDDSYNKTDSLTIVVDKERELAIKERGNLAGIITRNRIRYEPCVQLHLDEESGAGELIICISHHKGAVYIESVFKETKPNG